MAYKLKLWTPNEKVIELDEVFETHEEADDCLNGKEIAFGKGERI